MVIFVTIAGFEVKKILMDSGRTVEVLSWEAYKKIGLKEQALSRANPLYDFANHPIEVKGLITLSVILGDGKHMTMKYVQFFVVDHSMASNAIFERPTIRMAKIMVSMFYMKIKFPTRIGFGFLRPD